jgi:hypothetical protein
MGGKVGLDIVGLSPFFLSARTKKPDTPPTPPRYILRRCRAPTLVRPADGAVPSAPRNFDSSLSPFRVAGMMDPAYFVGRRAILDWTNNTFQMNLQKIEETASGGF